MKNWMDIENCYGCGACSQVCSNGCIEMVSDDEGFIYPLLGNADACSDCGKCKIHCPIVFGKTDNFNDTDYCYTTFAANNLDDNVRMNSSSGGIFSLFAEYYLENQGYVCGASFNEKFNVKHILIDSKEMLYKIMGSKYVQSDISEVLYQIKDLLEMGKSVLFSGTPCQIAGLKAYLIKNYDNLLCIEIICHGVPSPMIWNDYFRMKEGNNNKISTISFRNKKDGWKAYSVMLQYEDGKSEKEKFWDNIYMKGFLADLYLRKTCYKCGFKGNLSVADIELGDCWGAQDICPSLDDDKGTSVIIIKTKKGMDYFNYVAHKINKIKVDYNDVVKYNPSLEYSSDNLFARKLFFDEYKKTGFYNAVVNTIKGEDK